MATAIRITELGRYFGPQFGLRPVSAALVWQHLRGVFGFPAKASQRQGIQRGVMIAGQVLKDISLEIDKGSIVCLDGPSGSGKSVLLRILAGMIQPTEGRIEIYGTVSSLLGAGENLDEAMSALENIENERVMQGVEADAEQYARDVIAFAGLEKFERIPVSKYSTGMTMRLSLALALQGNPDILLLDDVLSVGDLAFQQQCVERMLELKAAGCTMVLALRDESLVRQLATRVITLEGGKMVSDEPPSQLFLGQHGFGTADVSWHIPPGHVENDAAALRGVKVTPVSTDKGTELDVEMDYEIKLAPQRCRPLIDVVCDKGRLLRTLYERYIDIPAPRSVRLAVRIPVHLLGERKYVLATALLSLHDELIYNLNHDNAVSIEVKRSFAPPSETVSLPLITPILPWEVEILREEA